MDNNYIREICDAYYNDRHLRKLNIWEKKDLAVESLFQEINSLMQSVRLEDSELYYEMHSYDTRIQQIVMYRLLDEYMQEKYASDTLNEGIISGVSDLIGGVASGAGNVAKAVGNTAVDISQGTASGTIATILAVPILAAVFWKHISRAGIEILNSLNKINETVSKLIHNMTATGKVKRAVLISHLDLCGPKCHITGWKDISPLASMAMTGGIYSEKAKGQAECLTTCYLEWTISQVEALAKAYNECLKSTGERPSELGDTSIFLKHPIGEKCSVYYSVLKDHHKNFNDAINVIYTDDLREKQDWINKYNQSLSRGLNETQRDGNRPPQHRSFQPQQRR